MAASIVDLRPKTVCVASDHLVSIMKGFPFTKQTHLWKKYKLESDNRDTFIC